MMERQSKSVRILDLIAASGEKGMRFTDIQRALWTMSNMRPFTRALRGYWCTNLLGVPFYREGLLRFFCEKNEDGNWVRNELPHMDHPWNVMSGNLALSEQHQDTVRLLKERYSANLRAKFVKLYGENAADAVMDHHRRMR